MTVTVGGISTSIAVRRVLPTRDHETGTRHRRRTRSQRHGTGSRDDPAAGVAARIGRWGPCPPSVATCIRRTGRDRPDETVWGNVCGCACG